MLTANTSEGHKQKETVAGATAAQTEGCEGTRPATVSQENPEPSCCCLTFDPAENSQPVPVGLRQQQPFRPGCFYWLLVDPAERQRLDLI